MPPQDRQAGSREHGSAEATQVDSTLIKLARLLARQAAREDHSASLKERDADNGKDAE
jgi:hypothetical protein